MHTKGAVKEEWRMSIELHKSTRLPGQFSAMNHHFRAKKWFTSGNWSVILHWPCSCANHKLFWCILDTFYKIICWSFYCHLCWFRPLFWLFCCVDWDLCFDLAILCSCGALQRPLKRQHKTIPIPNFPKTIPIPNLELKPHNDTIHPYA